jgi:hypothetical protein
MGMVNLKISKPPAAAGTVPLYSTGVHAASAAIARACRAFSG